MLRQPSQFNIILPTTVFKPTGQVEVGVPVGIADEGYVLAVG